MSAIFTATQDQSTVTALPEIVIFDWDGTVVDSTQTIAHAICEACRDIDAQVPSMERASYVIGLGLQDALNHVAPGLSADRQKKLGERFRHHYLARDQFLQPFPGMTGVFDFLKSLQLPLAVATGKSRVGLERAFDATQTRHYFSTSRCADETDPKPAPTMVLEICEELGITPERALVIGDTTHDMYMGKSAGASVLAVTYGAHKHDLLKEASPLDYMHSVEELHNWMRQWTTN
jgi:phosphoglycolate phosphatase